MDDNFVELSDLLQKRSKTFGRLGDEFERMANSYNYLDKTKPTERVKTEKEIEMEKEREIKRKLQKEIRQGTDDEGSNDDNENEKAVFDNERKNVHFIFISIYLVLKRKLRYFTSTFKYAIYAYLKKKNLNRTNISWKYLLLFFF